MDCVEVQGTLSLPLSMRVSSLKSLSSLFVPDGLLLLAAIAFLRPTGLPKWTAPMLLTYDYLVLALAILVAWYVGLSRVVFATLLLALADGALGSFSLASRLPAVRHGVFNTVGLLLPLNFLALALIQERHLAVRRDIAWFVVILMQALLVVGLCLAPSSGWAAVILPSLDVTFIDPRWLRWSVLNQASLLAFAAALVLVTARFIVSGSRLDRGFFWSLLAAFIAMQGAARGWSPTHFLATAGLILMVALYADEYRLSHYDELTNLPDRAAFLQTLKEVKGQFTIAVIDIDNMKQINTDYGEALGNVALRLLAAKLRRLRRGQAFRCGGDKFAVIFQGRTVSDVLPRLEALKAGMLNSAIRLSWTRRLITRRAERYVAADLVVTVSIGAAETGPRASTGEQVLRYAEQALLQAKQAGRNEVRALASGEGR